MQASPEQRIYNLETARARLVNQSLQLQQKIDSLEKVASLPSEEGGR